MHLTNVLRILSYRRNQTLEKVKVTLRAFYMSCLTVVLAGGCQIYHDTTARYNAYFLAKEKLLEVETTLFGNPNDDYNDVLNVLVKLDTN